MLTENQLKVRLTGIAAHDYTPPNGPELGQILEAAVAHIGSLDPILRDELIYTTLARWIMRGQLSSEQIMALLETALDGDHIGYRLGEEDGDGVFRRSFSVLLLPPALIAHRERKFLPAETILRVHAAALAYLKSERDRRGYIPSKGWAHAIAHAADTLDDLAQCDELGRQELLQILDAALHAMAYCAGVYTHEEDERMSFAVVAVLGRDEISLEDVESWLNALEKIASEELITPLAHYRRANLKQFLRSLYFRLPRSVRQNRLPEGKAEAVRGMLEPVIEKLVLF